MTQNLRPMGASGAVRRGAGQLRAPPAISPASHRWEQAAHTLRLAKFRPSLCAASFWPLHTQGNPTRAPPSGSLQPWGRGGHHVPLPANTTPRRPLSTHYSDTHRAARGAPLHAAWCACRAALTAPLEPQCNRSTRVSLMFPKLESGCCAFMKDPHQYGFLPLPQS